jgi:hypothetical protein
MRLIADGHYHHVLLRMHIYDVKDRVLKRYKTVSMNVSILSSSEVLKRF